MSEIQCIREIMAFCCGGLTILIIEKIVEKLQKKNEAKKQEEDEA